LQIGARTGAGVYFDGLIDDVLIYNRALTPDEIKRLYEIGGTFKVNTVNPESPLNKPESGLVGWWTFDGPDDLYGGPSFGTLTAYDKSGNGNKGVQETDAAIPALTIGILGQALNFDGVDDYLKAPAVTDILPDVLTEFTASYWLQVNGLTNESSAKSLGYRRTSATGISFQFETAESPANVVAYVSLDGVEYNSSVASGVLTSGQWYHLAMTFSGGNTTTVYLNGAQILQQIGENSDGGLSIANGDRDSVLMGVGNRGLSTQDFGGIIDDVRIYDRALTESEIKTLFQMGSRNR
jgi:hypothetical protein